MYDDDNFLLIDFSKKENDPYEEITDDYYTGDKDLEEEEDDGFSIDKQ